MDGGVACCGACSHALAVQARGDSEPSHAPVLRAREAGILQGVTIVIVRGRDVGRTIALDKPELLVGRSAEADIRLQDDMISRRQCRFLVREGNVYVEDLGSSCGTYVDDEKVGSAPLREGQRVLVGDTIFQLRQTLCETR